MKALKKYLLWNSGRAFSRQMTNHTYHRTEVSASHELLQNIIEWNKTGALFTNFQYNHLQALFAHDNGSQFFDLFTKTLNYDPAKLLSYAKYAPQTQDGNQLLIKLMHQYANIGDYSSCSVLFKWICEDLSNKIVSIDYYNILLKSIYNHTQNPDTDNSLILESWDVWCDIKKAPIAFTEHTIFYLIHILKSNDNHITQFVDELLSHYDAVISTDVNTIAHLLPYIHDTSIALQKYKKNVHLHPNKLSLAMFAHIVNHLHVFDQNMREFNSQMIDIIQHCSTATTMDVITKKSIANTLSRICLLPPHQKTKYKFDNTDTLVSIFKSLIDDHSTACNTHFINYLLDQTTSMEDINILCKQYAHGFDIQNVYNMVHRVLFDLKVSKQINHAFIAFVMHTIKKHMQCMSFEDARLSLKLLSILDRHFVNNNRGEFIGIMESIQKQMIALFVEHKKWILVANSKVNHKCIVYNIDEVIGIMSAFSKHRTYSQELMAFLAEQIVVNIQKRNPQYAASITYFNHDTKQRHLEKDVLILFPIYTTILRHLRYLNFYQKKVYELIASTLQKRPDIIKVEELREWCLAFGATQHKSNSIWLSIQSVLLHHYPTSEDVVQYMALDMLIDFVWSMSVLDLIPNYWLMSDLIQMLNDRRNRQNIEDLAFIHKARLWEIFQSLYANQTCYQSLNLVDKDVIESLQGFYDEYVVAQFQQQCRLRPSLHKFCTFLNDKQIDYQIGGSLGNMMALCDIVIPRYKICIEVFDYPHVTKRSQNRTREWAKSKARREITRRLIENTQNKWHFILVNGVDEEYDMDAFSRLMHKFVFVERMKDQCNDVDAENMDQRRFGVNLSLAT